MISDIGLFDFEIGKYTKGSLLDRYSSDFDQQLQRSKLNVIKEKIIDCDYHRYIKDENGNNVDITLLLLYEYSTAIESITKGKVPYYMVIDKLKKIMSKFRLGEFEARDNHLQYGKSFNDKNAMLVNSPKFKQQIRAKGFGAGTFCYIDSNGNYKNAVIMFGKRQNISGSDIVELSDSDFKNLSEIRQIIFHEWSHVMEIDFDIDKDLPEVFVSPDGRKFLNFEEVNQYVSLFNREKTIKLQKPIRVSIGLATIQLDEHDTSHNQITEGFVEIISRRIIQKIMKNLGHSQLNIEKAIDIGKNMEQTEIAERIIDSRGEVDTITTLLTHSSFLKKELESKTIDGTDGLHYISDYANKAKNKNTERWRYINQIEKFIKKQSLDRNLDEKEIGNLKIWYETKVSEQSIIEFKQKLGDINDDKLNLQLNSLIQEYKRIVDKERTFFDNIPNKLGYMLKRQTED